MYRLEFNVSAIILVIFLYFISRIKYQVFNVRTKLLYIMLCCNGIAALAGIVAYNGPGFFPGMPKAVVTAAVNLEILLQSSVSVGIFYYNYYLIRPYMHGRLDHKSPFFMPYYVICILLCINIFYPVCFTVGGDLLRQDLPGIYAIFAIKMIYNVSTFIMMVRHKEQVNQKKRLATYFYLLILLGGKLAGSVWPDIPALNFCISTALAIIILNIQDTEEMLDEEIKVFNQGCFKEDVIWRIGDKKQFHLLYLYFSGLSDYREVLPQEKRTAFFKKLLDILYKTSNGKACYRLTPEVFAVLYEENDKKLMQKSSGEFLHAAKAYFSAEEDTGIVPRVCMMSHPKDLETMEDMLSVGEYLTNQLKYYPDEVIPVEKVEIQKQNKRVQLGKRILEILQNNAYEICYQPVYDRKKKMITGACARVRLHDENMQNYEDYVEDYGRLQGVLMFEDRMFEDVCEAIQKSNAISNGKEFIEVAFSDAQFMQGDFVEKILGTLERYGVQPERIRLCITEPVLASMNTVIENNLHRLAEAGISFSLVNYGTGQSNFDRLNRLTFDTVEFDDRLVSKADFDDKEKEIILTAQLEALHRFGKKIRIYIDEKEDNPIAKQLSSDYVRGMAVPEEQFAAMLQKQTAILAMSSL
jgi:EAL domain-containing protein (putative c-di-GMP-specific phosphodiesterase class I)